MLTRLNRWHSIAVLHLHQRQIHQHLHYYHVQILNQEMLVSQQNVQNHTTDIVFGNNLEQLALNIVLVLKIVVIIWKKIIVKMHLVIHQTLANVFGKN